jgi:iron complex transport system permease protein
MMTHLTRRLLFLQLLTITGIIISLLYGSTSISLHQLLYNEYGEFHTVLMQLRLPRTLSAFTAGGLLALSGALMQLLLQNPLADPYVLGISSGAAFFSLLLMLLGVSGDILLPGAWFGSLMTAGLILLLARHHRWQIHTLLLTGMAIASGFAAGISLILIQSPDAGLHSMLFWLMGDLNDTHYSLINMILLFAGTGWLARLGPALNLLARGDKEARALGLAVQPYRLLIFLLSSLFAAAAVTQSGCIGFVGLIVPHFARRIISSQHRIMLPASVLIGGTLVVLADTLSRWLFAPIQIPVGIILAFIGIPIFICLIRS